MATILEAKAIITADDRTGPAFQAIEAKIAAMSKTASQVSSITARMSQSAQSVARAQAAVVGGGGGGGLMAAGGAMIARQVAALAATVGTVVSAHQAVTAASARVHEQMRMGAAGMDPDEIAEAQRKAADVHAQMPSIDTTTGMHMLRNARSIVGTYEEAAEILEPMAKLRILAQAARPGADVTEDLDQLIKGLEIKGVTQNKAQFLEYMEGIAKGVNAFGDTLKPYQYYEMFKYGRQATPTLSEKFILSTAPTLAQEMGGSSFGKAVSGFNNALIGGVMKHAALKDLASLGLIRHDALTYTKTGEAKGFKPGEHVEGWRLAQSNPNEWIKQYYLPALARAGVTSKEGISQRISQDFQNTQTAQLVGILATQQARIDKDAALIEKAAGLSAAEKMTNRDPSTIWQGFKSSLESVAGTAFQGLVKDFSPQIAGFSKAVAQFDAAVQKSDSFLAGLAKFARDHWLGPEGKKLYDENFAPHEKASDVFGRMRKGEAAPKVEPSEPSSGFDWRPQLGARGKELYEGAKNAFHDLFPLPRFDDTLFPASGGYAGDAAMLRMRPAKDWANVNRLGGLYPSLGPDRAQKVQLDGAAAITNRVEIVLNEPMLDARIDQRIAASGNLRADTGRSMPEATPGAWNGE
jgi:hypothetical protein